ncbi:histidine kinase [Kosakonia sp. SMBL-WEM22]|uniref:biofilm development regulator YmgB/AriR family protein n=1 Tax=Kosakonia sp. SMBL-WEM22 TaxID=2725560 RepID=UPI00165985AD|nr:biofilm development regulator YmgB/AriR family protein [Kosakonia sp. SMBL-WEM22]QNQ20891.1 histidine kinase [Kosakonia sp. SMBL-WEM22]
MNTVTAISEHAHHGNLHALDAEQVISEITFTLQEAKTVVTNKDLILALIARLGSETDVNRNDILRNALEMIVLRTPDDI